MNKRGGMNKRRITALRAALRAKYRAVADAHVEQEIAMVRLYAAGESTYDIGRKLGLGKSTIQERLKGLGVVLRRQNGLMKGITQADVATMARRYRKGETMQAIAKGFGVHRKTVAYHLRKSGVSARADAPPRREANAPVSHSLT